MNENRCERTLAMETVEGAEEILCLLRQFDGIFPHLKEKIADYRAFAEKLAAHAVVYAARESGEACGLLVFYANDTVGRISYTTLIGVLPAWQGTGLAGQLLTLWETTARERGMTALRLEVDLDNPRAIRFYEKHGFAPVGDRTENSMYLQKSITP